MFHIVANLDQEAHWLGAKSLPLRVRESISAYASLLAALAPDGDVSVWALAPVEADRLLRTTHWRPPAICVGTPPRIDLRWSDPDAKSVNDRRFALELATTLGCALPGSRSIGSFDELERHVAEGGADASPTREWVCKAPWTSAGRDRCFGGPELTAATREASAKLVRRTGVLVFEPWMRRICDIAVCGVVGERIIVDPPHGLISSRWGAFRGIDLATTGLEFDERDTLVTTAEQVGTALHTAGYRGPYGVDAFVWSDGEQRHLHPLCEVNARYTFGHVARALGARLGITKLGFAGEPPAGATVLVRPSPRDAATVWVST